MRDCILYLVITQKEMHLFRGSSEFAQIGQKLLVNLRVQTLGGIRKTDISSIIARYDNLTATWASSLPPELQRMLSEKDVIIFSPDGIISYFPLEGLSICDEPICLSKKVMRAASIHQVQEITPRVELHSSLIIGNPWPSVDEQSLSYMYPSRIGPIGYLEEAEKEAQMLAEHLPEPHVFVGSHAVRDEVLRVLPHHSLIHFAGHGWLGRVLFFAGPMVKFPSEFEPEEFAHLRKAWRMTNGSITHMMDEWDILTDIDILDIPLKKGALVFLSACETGKHTYAGGGHFQGLAQSFLKSGASNVISSLIPLYGAPARDFAVSFYDNLFSGMSVSISLQNARKRIREKYKGHIYWLPYIHYGSV